MKRLQIVAHNARQALIALDQLINTLLGLAVALVCLLPCLRRADLWWGDETISAHCWRWEKNGVRAWPRKFVDMLFFFDENHCRESYENEKLGRQLPPELRKTS